MERAAIAALAKGMVPAIKEYVEKQTRELDARAMALETRLTALETKFEEFSGRGLRYAGVYQRAIDYRRGDAVTADGSLFIAIKDVPPGEKPGASDLWQLAAKAGRDGKDAK